MLATTKKKKSLFDILVFRFFVGFNEPKTLFFAMLKVWHNNLSSSYSHTFNDVVDFSQ